MLMEHETQKLKELDETYAQELKDWKQQLKPRKQVNYLVQLLVKGIPVSSSSNLYMMVLSVVIFSTHNLTQMCF